MRKWTIQIQIDRKIPPSQRLAMSRRGLLKFVSKTYILFIVEIEVCTDWLIFVPAPPLGPKKGTYSCSTFHEKRGSFWGRSAIRVFVKKGTFYRQKFAISTLIDFLWQVDSPLIKHHPWLIDLRDSDSSELENRGYILRMKIRDLSEKGVLFVAQIRGKGGCFLTLEHEYMPFLGPRGGAGIFVTYHTPFLYG